MRIRAWLKISNSTAMHLEERPSCLRVCGFQSSVSVSYTYPGQKIKIFRSFLTPSFIPPELKLSSSLTSGQDNLHNQIFSSDWLLLSHLIHWLTGWLIDQLKGNFCLQGPPLTDRWGHFLTNKLVGPHEPRLPSERSQFFSPNHFMTNCSSCHSNAAM